MALQVLSNIEVPFPRTENTDTQDAVNKEYVANKIVAQENFASVYDEADFYDAGAIVTHNGVLYKCTQSTNGVFDSTKWDAISLFDYLTDKIPNTYINVPSSWVNTNVRNTSTIAKFYRHKATSATYAISTSMGVGFDSNTTNHYLQIPSTVCTTDTSTFTLTFKPTLATTYWGTTDATTLYITTHELIICCMGSTGNTFNFNIVDANNVNMPFLENGALTTLEHGYVYFLVGRNFPVYTTSTSTIARKWIFNYQCRLPIT